MEDDSHQSLLSAIRAFIRKKKAPERQCNALAEEIHGLMDAGQARGLISGEESDMVHGVLDLKQTEVHSIMIPRTEISSASLDSTLGEVIKLVAECGHTRIPIYRDTIDHIRGILHAKDLLRFWGEDPQSRIPAEVLRSPFFTPRNQKVSELFRNLKAQKNHLAIVTDEYGGTEGIITIEDIIEEIVGEIEDEHDSERHLLTVLDDHAVLVDARLEIEKLEEHLGMKLPEGEFESVGGFVIYLTGRIPRVQETITWQDLEMTIKSADDRKINQILINRRIPETAPEEKDVL